MTRPRPRRLRHPRPAPPATRTLERARPRVPADARVSGARADLGRGLAARAEARRLAGAGHRGRQGDRANPQRPGRHEFLPELTGLADALAGRTAVLDGELVAGTGAGLTTSTTSPPAWRRSSACRERLPGHVRRVRRAVPGRPGSVLAAVLGAPCAVGGTQAGRFLLAHQQLARLPPAGRATGLPRPPRRGTDRQAHQQPVLRSAIRGLGEAQDAGVADGARRATGAAVAGLGRQRRRGRTQGREADTCPSSPCTPSPPQS